MKLTVGCIHLSLMRMAFSTKCYQTETHHLKVQQKQQNRHFKRFQITFLWNLMKTSERLSLSRLGLLNAFCAKRLNDNLAI
jgi:hypothetical protein